MKKMALLILPVLGVSAAAMAQTVYMQPPPPQVVMQQPPVVVAQPVCRPYSDTLKIGAEKRITRGSACLQPDGSWALHPEAAAVNYVARGGALYVVPAQPFVADVVIGHDHHHHW